jgi:MIP family channel proteins
MLKRFEAELVGTFGIVFAPAAVAASGHAAGGDPSLMVAALVSGLAVTAMVSTFGPISAAHFNPAVTLGFVVARRFPARFAIGYIAAQLTGATLAAGLAALMFGSGFGAHIPSVGAGTAIGLEATLTALLMLVIIAVATDSRVDGALPALAIGLTVTMDVLIGGPLTGGSMNPARSLGPALFNAKALAMWWVYLVGPVVGACLAALIYESLRLHHQHAKAAPNEIFETLNEIGDVGKA